MKSLSGWSSSNLDVSHLPVIAFAKFDFGSQGIWRYCTASFTFSANVADGAGVQSWTGLGGLVSLDPIRETGDVESIGLRATLVGFDTSIQPSPTALALSTPVQGSACSIWLGILTDNYQLIGTPSLEFQGRIDTLSIIEEGSTATMSINMESRFASILRPNVRRMTDRDQQSLYPGDKFFEFLPQMREKAIIFPSREAQMR